MSFLKFLGLTLLFLALVAVAAMLPGGFFVHFILGAVIGSFYSWFVVCPLIFDD